MADDNLDEDLFADLYEDNDVPSVKQEPIKQEPIPQPVRQEPQDAASFNGVQAPAIAASSDFMAAKKDEGGMQPWDAKPTPGATDDNYGPVGIKEDGKMFIGGLNWETTDESLRDYFLQFGDVVECTVMRDSTTGRSRGFGFLTFVDPKVVNTVMVKEHQLDGKIIDPKRAIPREEQERTSKIFVGGVSQEATETDFKEFFKQFGHVVDATLMMDKDTGRPRGFGFVTFEGDEAVDRTLAGPLQICGKPIEVKRAQPRGNLHDEDRGGRFGRNNRFGRGQDNNTQQGNQNLDNNTQQSQPAANGMSQAQMAAYWQRMQQYFNLMQQAIQNNMTQQAQMNPMAAMGGQMNPQMMQQMMAMQQAQQQQQQQNMVQSPDGTPGPQSPGSSNGTMNMNPQMMQQMQQMMAMQQGGGGGQGMQNGASPVNGGFNAPAPAGPAAMRNNGDQNFFEQQKYERQQQQRMQQNQQYAQAYSNGGQTGWEGMYDDIPPPNQGGGQGGGFRGNFGGQGRRSRGQGGGGQGGGHGNVPTGPSNAPANAPTGPKNAGKPYANYRGGGRNQRGGANWKPY